MQLSGAFTVELPAGRSSGAFTVEVPVDQVAQDIATRVAAILAEHQQPDTGRHGEDFAPGDVNQHRHAVRFSPDPDQLYGEGGQ